MILNITTHPVPSPSAKPSSQGAPVGRVSSAASVSMSPQQTPQLQPGSSIPANPGADPQEVYGSKQQSQRLVDDLRQQAEKANAYMKQSDTHLQFEVSENTGRVVITVIDSETKEVVRKIPPEVMEKVSNRMTQMRGLLFETRG